MKIIILGAGQVGSTVVQSLVSESNDITVVDQNPLFLKSLSDQFNIKTTAGRASHPEVLIRAGIEDADLILAVTNSDETNMVACQIAHLAVGEGQQRQGEAEQHRGDGDPDQIGGKNPLQAVEEFSLVVARTAQAEQETKQKSTGEHRHDHDGDPIEAGFDGKPADAVDRLQADHG